MKSNNNYWTTAATIRINQVSISFSIFLNRKTTIKTLILWTGFQSPKNLNTASCIDSSSKREIIFTIIHSKKIVRNFLLEAKITGCSHFILSSGSWMQGCECFLRASTRVGPRNSTRLATLLLTMKLGSRKDEEICGARLCPSVAQATSASKNPHLLVVLRPWPQSPAETRPM